MGKTCAVRQHFESFFKLATTEMKTEKQSAFGKRTFNGTPFLHFGRQEHINNLQGPKVRAGDDKLF